MVVSNQLGGERGHPVHSPSPRHRRDVWDAFDRMDDFAPAVRDEELGPAVRERSNAHALRE
jgi:hypothetical protein